MGDAMLSQSLLRDPFAQAKTQHDSRQNQPQDQNVLSSSLVGDTSNAPLVPPIPDFKSILSKIGIQGENLMMNDMGRIQLNGRLRQKFGDKFMDNPSAIEALQAFDAHVKQNPMDGQKSLNKGMESTNRTLQALLGSSGGMG